MRVINSTNSAHSALPSPYQLVMPPRRDATRVLSSGRIRRATPSLRERAACCRGTGSHITATLMAQNGARTRPLSAVHGNACSAQSPSSWRTNAVSVQGQVTPGEADVLNDGERRDVYEPRLLCRLPLTVGRRFTAAPPCHPCGPPGRRTGYCRPCAGERRRARCAPRPLSPIPLRTPHRAAPVPHQVSGHLSDVLGRGEDAAHGVSGRIGLGVRELQFRAAAQPVSPLQCRRISPGPQYG